MSNIVNYPENPTIGQEFMVGNTTKYWDGEKWTNKSTGQHERRITSLEQMVAGNALSKNSIRGLLEEDVSDLADGTYAVVASFHTVSLRGGGLFTWDSDRPKQEHNGGTVIDPDKTFPASWIVLDQQDWLSASNTGSGCWVRVLESDEFDARWFGLKADNSDEYPVIQATVDALYNHSLYGGQVTLPSGRIYTSTAINSYNQTVFDPVGNVTTIGNANPKNVKPTLHFKGANTVWRAAENGSCIKPESATLPAFYDLFCHGIIFVGENKTGKSVDIQRDLASPVRIKFYNCQFTNFEHGYAYLPFVEGGSNPRNGFVGFYSCYFTYNKKGLHTNGCDNIFIDDTVFESNDEFGYDVEDAVSFVMTGGKLQYNGTVGNNMTAQAILRGTCRNVTHDTVYLEGGASTNENTNAGDGQASILIDGNITSWEWNNGYMNGLRAECPIRILSGGFQRVKLTADILNYQLNTSREVIQGDSTFRFTQTDFDNIVYGVNYDSLGSPLAASPVCELTRTYFKDTTYNINPNIVNGCLHVRATGVGATTLYAKIIFNIDGTSTEAKIISAGSSVILATDNLDTHTGTAGMLNIGFQDGLQIRNNLAFNIVLALEVTAFT